MSEPDLTSRASGVIHAQTPVDLTVSAERAARDRLADRTDVLDKVGVLRCLPDDMHVTTTEAATFYEVDVELVRYHLKANRDELESDGYRVVDRAEFEREFGSLSNLNPRARTIGLFPRRAVLRLGMLLRDSAPARKVRDYLLNAEQVLPFRVPQTYAEALRAAADQVERAERAESKVAELEPSAVAWDRLHELGSEFEVADAAKILSRDPNIQIGRNRLFDVMHQHGWIFRGRRNCWKAYQPHVDNGRLKHRPGGEYFHKGSGEYRTGDPTIVVTPKGLADLRVLLGGSGQLEITAAS